MRKIVISFYLIFIFCLSLSSGLNCNDGKIRGVNLGGWLVLEKWITPTLFKDFQIRYGAHCPGSNFKKGRVGDDIHDEWNLAVKAGKDSFYKERLRIHWDSFYTKQEIKLLSDSGISHVRIPVPYWFWQVNSDEPYPEPNLNENDENSPLFYLKRMMEWLDEFDMSANIDLHTAPGSQNGFDNSGRTGDPHWVEWGQVGRSKLHIRLIAETVKDWLNKNYFKRRTVYSFCVLNEPDGRLEDIWNACRNDYYPDAYRNIREVFPDWDIGVNIQQAFRQGWEFDSLMVAPEFQSVSVDMHVYQCFGDWWNSIHNDDAGKEIHFNESCKYALDVKDRYHWTFTGEWSLGNPGPWDFNDPSYVEFLRLWFLAQIDAFEYGEKGFGWFFWTGKIEGTGYPEWNYLGLLEKGIAPENLCNRQTFCIFKKDNMGRLISTSFNQTLAIKSFKN